MKTIFVFLSTILVIALTLPMFGQKTPSNVKKHDMSGMMGKPTAVATVKGVHIEVWISTQKQHRKIISGMRDNSMGMDMETKIATMSGTHHMMLVVTEVANGKKIAATGVKVLIVSPSGKNSTIDLKKVMDRFENGLTLGEKGKYRFTAIVNDEGIPKPALFTYRVK